MTSVIWNQCVCHGYSDNPGTEATFTAASWAKLCEAAKRRKDHVYETLKPYIDGTVPLPLGPNSIVKHVNCYKVYTLEKSVLLMEKKRAANSPLEDVFDGVAGCSPQKRLTRSEFELTDLGKCIICQEQYLKDRKDRRRTHEATPFTLPSAVQKLKEAAAIRNDRRIVNQLAGGARGGTDAIAGDLLKHDACYNEYTHPGILQAWSKASLPQDHDPSENALDDIITMIQKSVVEEQTVWTMDTVRNLYLAALARHGSFTKPSLRHLKDKLATHFGNNLRFYRPPRRNQPTVLFSSQTEIGTIIHTCQEMEHALEDEAIEDDLNFSADDEQTPMYSAYYLGLHIRKELEQVQSMKWPPTPDCCTTQYVESSIPIILFNMVTWIAAAENNFTEKHVKLDDAKQKKVLSICQDILYCCRGGRILTPKHVSLAMAVRRATGGTELLTMLNKFGHTVSTSKVQEIESAIGELRQQEGEALLPSNIVKHVPAMFVFDNNDFQEETPTGKGTTHCTNGIVIQPRVHTCIPKQTTQVMPSTGRHRRSLTYAQKPLRDYPVAPRLGPDRVQDAAALITSTSSTCVDEAGDQDMVWLLSRLCPDLQLPESIYTQLMPGWSRHNQIMCSTDEGQLPHNIGYMPVINEAPSDLSTVYTALTNASSVVDLLDCPPTGAEHTRPSVVITADQAVYAKAVEVCNNPRVKDDLENIVLRMGAFHISMTFIAVIGRRYASAGLRDILVEADVLAVGSVDQVLNGRHYNRAIRCLKSMLEAMWRLRWQSFMRWMAEEHGSDSADFGSLYGLLSDVRQNLSSEQVNVLLMSEEFNKLKEDFARYLEICGPNATFWSGFIEMVQLLFCFIRSTRTRNWPMHIQCLQEMLPWMMAYDRTNYSRYLPVYIMDMMRLSSTHPDIHAQLMAGEFAVQLSNNSTFCSIPHDQTIEVTINRDTKTSGGLVGTTLRHETVNKWIWIAADKARYYECSKDLCGMGSGSACHKDGGKARMKRDEETVQQIIATVSALVNPFTDQDVITHVTSGKHASTSIEADLLSAGQTGLKAAHTFAAERLSTDGNTSFHDPLPRLSLKTFASLTAKSRQARSTDLEQETTAIFALLYDVGNEAKVDRDVLLSYELTSIPRSLADADGAKHANKKADLLHILSDMATDATLPLHTTHVIDAMAVLQSITHPASTYADLAVQVFLLALKGTSNQAVVHWVVDTYPDVSIKRAEHGRRGDILGGALEYTIKSGSQRVPCQFKRALRSAQYKEELILFFIKTWSDDIYSKYIGGRTVYVTAGQECFRLSVDMDMVQCVPQVDLTCQHEEADTRLLLHVVHASAECDQPILLRSPDTDVLVLAVHVCGSRPESLPLVFRVQHQKAWRYVDVSSIARHLGVAVCEALPGLHAFGGCDSTSQFVGRGKKTTMKLLDNTECLEAMILLGRDFDATQNTVEKAEAAICCLYNSPGCIYTNEVRNLKWNRTTKDITKLPPCHDSAVLHIRRANYQAAIWRRCLQADMDTPSPDGHGWQVSGADIAVVWMMQPRAPDSVLSVLKCSCKSNMPCTTRRCGCRHRGVPCTHLCMCTDQCWNRTGVNNADNEEDEQDSDME